MITADQPTCFPANVLVRVSSRDDGTMLDRTLADRHHESVVENRKRFCARAGVRYDNTVYQIISYEPNSTYDVIYDATLPNAAGIHADVLYTETPHIALFLPIADCVGTVIYDPGRHALALAHLGRHASLARALSKTIKHFTDKGSDPADLIVWMAPSIAQSAYRMEYFDHADDSTWRDFVDQRDDGYYLDIAGHNKRECIDNGIDEVNIFLPTTDTATNPNYYSHFQGDKTSRFAVIASLK